MGGALKMNIDVNLERANPELNLKVDLRKVLNEEKENVKAKTLKIIQEDISYQQTLLTGEFEKDKVFKWRIESLEAIKKKVMEL